MERRQRDEWAREARQYQVARNINLISPGYAFQYAMEAVLGVGVVNRDALEEQMWVYRDELREAFRLIDAEDPASPKIPFYAEYMSTAPLDHRRIPRFRERRLSVAEGISSSTAPIVILVLETLAALLFAVWSVNRMDITRE